MIAATLRIRFNILAFEVDFILVFIGSDSDDLIKILGGELFDIAISWLFFMVLNVFVNGPECLSKGGIEIVLDVVVGAS